MTNQYRIPKDALKEVFTDDVIADLCSERDPSENLRFRLFVLESWDLESVPPDLRPLLPDRRKWRAAWETYLTAGFAVGLFDGEHGRDLLSRLRSKDDANFRSAMSECMVAWFLVGKLRLTVEPRPTGRPNHPLELCIKHVDGDIYVEVKAPHHLMINGPYYGDNSKLLQTAIKSASDQFKKNVRNLLVIAPQFFLSLSSLRSQITRAFFGDLVISIPFDKVAGRADGPTTLEFESSGQFLETHLPSGRPFKPDRTPPFTRVSAVLCIEESEDPTQVIHKALVVHNPHARKPISENMWEGIPQFVLREGKMVWTDGASPWQGRGLSPGASI